MLTDFPAYELYETIPDFHNTRKRFFDFVAAVGNDPVGRVKYVEQEIDFLFDRRKMMSQVVKMIEDGVLPLRVTHNDTKINNVMIDSSTGEALCVIDLDTVMPGLAAHDFGDAIRFGASTAAEDERELSKVSLSLPCYEAFAEGFLGACGDSLTEAELETLPLGAKLMTLECGMRFLADYLNGDVYFRVSRPGQNLDRARTQLKLVQDMERQWDEMLRIAARARG